MAVEKGKCLKNLILLLKIAICSLILVSCNGPSGGEPSSGMNKEQVRRLFHEVRRDFEANIRPKFSDRFPGEGLENCLLKLNKNDPNIDGGAIVGQIDITIPAIQLEETLRTFILYHEMGHVITVFQAQNLLLGNVVPGDRLKLFKKSEFLADLIAVHLMDEGDRDRLVTTLRRNLQAILGPGDNMHPPGKDRVQRIVNYSNAIHGVVNDAQKEARFEQSFREMWNAL